MPNRDLIVVGASAGGVEALQAVLEGLPDDLRAAVMVVLHMPPAGGRALSRILARPSRLPVVIAAEGKPIQPGCVYVCVGGMHLLVGSGHMHVRTGPRENGHRPAVDPLFRSAAVYYGPRVIGVVLSGGMSDGTAGLRAIRRQGGIAVVQAPEDALFDSMPASALEGTGADYVSPAGEMGPLLERLVSETIDLALSAVPDGETPLLREVRILEGDDESLREHVGIPSPWPCPDCNGVLWEIDDGPLLRFRCRVGHAWAADALLEQQGDGVEAALWMALRALEDRVSLSSRLAERAARSGRKLSALRYQEEFESMNRSADILRRLLTAPPTGVATGARSEES